MRSLLSILSVLFILTTHNCFAQEKLKKTSELKDNSITTIFLVRHAEKENDGSRDPELSQTGEKRANKLSEMLIKSEITAIYSTNYKRTINTVKHLAKRTELEIQLYKPNDDAIINNILTKHKGGNILIVGHSNTIPGLVNKLLKKEKYDQLEDDEYNKLFIVSLAKETGKCIVQQF